MSESATIGPAEPTFWENRRRVTAWKWAAITVSGGWRVGKERWVYDARPGVEAWDQEQGEWAHEVPFDNLAQAEAVAASLNAA
jgi:hypothetical protein